MVRTYTIEPSERVLDCEETMTVGAGVITLVKNVVDVDVGELEDVDC